MTDARDDAGEPAELLSRQELYDAYVGCYRRPCAAAAAAAGPCRDARLLGEAARYLLREPRPAGAFTVFPSLDEALSRSPECCRKHLWAAVKAAELLETLCVNLFLQPWKKEIKTVKTFTGSFVYHLLPVFSSAAITSILASIGYVPHTDTPSEFRLSEDADPDAAMQVGFELLLARVECLHLLDLLDKEELGPQEWLEVVQRKSGPAKPGEPPAPEKRTTVEPRKEETDGGEGSPCLDPSLMLPPHHKPWHYSHTSVDQSIMEMQRNYPDLAFRGRPLVSDKPRAASRSSRSSRKEGEGDQSKGSRRSKVEKESGGNGGSCPQGPDGGGGDDELSGPQGISLHITLRSGSNVGRNLSAGDPQPPAEGPGWKQQAADEESRKTELSSMSSVDEDQDLRELAERMGQIHVQETQEEVSRRGEESPRRKGGRRTSDQEEPEEHGLRKPVMETGPAGIQDLRRCTRSSQSATTSHPPPPNVSTADGESSKGGGGGGGETVQGDEEHVAQGFIIVEHHEK